MDIEDEFVEEAFEEDDEFDEYEDEEFADNDDDEEAVLTSTAEPRSGTAEAIWQGPGLRVELKRIKGVTRKGVLKTPFRFQCPPLETFRVETAVGASDYTTIQNGVFTRMGDRELTVIVFDTLVTIAPEPWVVHKQGSYNPQKPISRLRKIMRAKTAFRLVAWHPGPVVELSMPVTLRSVGVEERAGEGDARYLNVSFTQWRDPIVRRRRRKRKFPIKHKLKKGDTLAKLGRKYFKSPTKGKQIRAWNPKLRKWGLNTPIVKHRKYKPGDIIIIRRPAKGNSGGIGPRPRPNKGR